MPDLVSVLGTDVYRLAYDSTNRGWMVLQNGRPVSGAWAYRTPLNLFEILIEHATKKQKGDMRVRFKDVRVAVVRRKRGKR